MAAITSITAVAAHGFVKRQIYGGYYGYNNGSAWGRWGRWVLLGCIIAVALLIFFLSSCINARRRKRQGNAPIYGTGWMAPHGDVNYYPQQETTTQPAPPYTEPVQNTGYYPTNGNTGYYPTNGNTGYYNQSQPLNQGYYGGQEQGIELQQPQNTYYPNGARAEEVYAPPVGAPPGKKERVV